MYYDIVCVHKVQTNKTEPTMRYLSVQREREYFARTNTYAHTHAHNRRENEREGIMHTHAHEYITQYAATNDLSLAKGVCVYTRFVCVTMLSGIVLVHILFLFLLFLLFLHSHRFISVHSFFSYMNKITRCDDIPVLDFPITPKTIIQETNIPISNECFNKPNKRKKYYTRTQTHTRFVVSWIYVNPLFVR